MREIHHYLEKSTCDPFKYIMGSPILIVSICMGNSTRIQSLALKIVFIFPKIEDPDVMLHLCSFEATLFIKQKIQLAKVHL